MPPVKLYNKVCVGIHLFVVMKMNKLNSVLAFLMCFGGLLASAQPAFIKDSLDIYVQREMQRWQVPGLAIAIVKDGKVVVEKGYGVRAFGKPEKVDEHTLFQIASNSKAFTGVALAWLNYDKRIGLDEKVTKYMPSFALYDSISTQLCTVRDLLCHRLGTMTFQGDFLNWNSNLTRAEIIAGLSRTKPVYPFRYKYGYSNAGFITAGELIPLVTDTSWDDFLRYRMFEPMGLKRTSTRYEAMKSDANACTPHTLVHGKITPISLANIDNMGPSASINSCVADMKFWLMLQLNMGKLNDKQIIPAPVLMEARKSNIVVNDVYSKNFKTKHFSTYGLGWSQYDYEGRRVIEHSGGANGFVTKTEFIPEEQLGVIVYTNSDENSLYDALCKQVIEAYLNVSYRNVSELYFDGSKKGKEEREKEWKEIRDTIAQKQPTPVPLNAYVGRYKNELYGMVEIKLIKGKLTLHFEHHPHNIGQLEHVKDGRFLCTYSDITCGIEPFYAETTGDGKVNTIRVKVNDFIDYLSYEFKREQ